MGRRGLGFRGIGLGVSVLALEFFRLQGFGFGCRGVGFRVRDLPGRSHEFRVQGLGFFFKCGVGRAKSSHWQVLRVLISKRETPGPEIPQPYALYRVFGLQL